MKNCDDQIHLSYPQFKYRRNKLSVSGFRQLAESLSGEKCPGKGGNVLPAIWLCDVYYVAFELPIRGIKLLSISSSIINVFIILRITTTSELVETPQAARCAYGAATIPAIKLIVQWSLGLFRFLCLTSFVRFAFNVIREIRV